MKVVSESHGFIMDEVKVAFHVILNLMNSGKGQMDDNDSMPDFTKRFNKGPNTIPYLIGK